MTMGIHVKDSWMIFSWKESNISDFLPPSYVRGNGINFLMILINSFDVCFIGIDVSIDGVIFKSVVFLMVSVHDSLTVETFPLMLSVTYKLIYIYVRMFSSPRAGRNRYWTVEYYREEIFTRDFIYVFTGWNITSFTRSTGATKPCMPKWSSSLLSPW